jgi:hypothetical protein
VLFISLALHRVPETWVRYLPGLELTEHRGSGNAAAEAA